MTTFNALSDRLTGPLLEPGHDEYAAVARAWNLAVEQRPLAVVDAHSTSDVVATVRFARQHGLMIATQPTGHGATGHSDDAILLRTGRLNGVRVDSAARTARVGAGALWGDVQQAASPCGLTGLAGSSSVVNVTGYLLGGGLSWFSRRHGWASDSVRALEIVDAAGMLRQVSATEEPELFWALRGGGGGFGIVTELEIDLYPAAPLYGGRVLWPLERASEVLDAYRNITAAAPDELSVWIDMLRIPGMPPMIAADSTYLGPPDEARELLTPLDAIPEPVISDSRATITPHDLGSITMEPTEPTPFLARTELLTDLTDQVLDALRTIPSDAMLSVRLRHLGGALTRPTDSAPGPLTEPYLLYLLGDPSHTEPSAIYRNRDDLLTALTENISGRRPFTYLSAQDTAADAFPADAIERLRKLRANEDPESVFRPNFDVLPR